MGIATALAAAIVPAGYSFDCTPTAVYDGDGPVWCAAGPRVRLAGIAAREIDGSIAAIDSIRSIVAEEARMGSIDLDGYIDIYDGSKTCLSRVKFMESFEVNVPSSPVWN